jgi:hypothetical protein
MTDSSLTHSLMNLLSKLARHIHAAIKGDNGHDISTRKSSSDFLPIIKIYCFV